MSNNKRSMSVALNDCVTYAIIQNSPNKDIGFTIATFLCDQDLNPLNTVTQKCKYCDIYCDPERRWWRYAVDVNALEVSCRGCCEQGWKICKKCTRIYLKVDPNSKFRECKECFDECCPDCIYTSRCWTCLDDYEDGDWNWTP